MMHGMVYGIAWQAWHGIAFTCFSKFDSTCTNGMVWPGGHGMTYGMAWPGGHNMV